MQLRCIVLIFCDRSSYASKMCKFQFAKAALRLYCKHEAWLRLVSSFSSSVRSSANLSPPARKHRRRRWHFFGKAQLEITDVKHGDPLSVFSGISLIATAELSRLMFGVEMDGASHHHHHHRRRRASSSKCQGFGESCSGMRCLCNDPRIQSLPASCRPLPEASAELVQHVLDT